MKKLAKKRKLYGAVFPDIAVNKNGIYHPGDLATFTHT